MQLILKYAWDLDACGLELRRYLREWAKALREFEEKHEGEQNGNYIEG